MNNISVNILKIFFPIIFIVALFVKAMYSFDDSPYFTSPTLYDLAMAIVATILFLLIVRYRDFIQQRINYKLCFAIFMLFAVLYIMLVPLKPFSDMSAVSNGAIRFSRFEFGQMLSDDYWNIFPRNILLAVFWGIVLIPLPKSIVTIKLINALLIYIISALSRSIAREYGVKYYNLVYLLALTFSPLFLYMNHIYFDLPVIFICMLSLYLYAKKKNLVLIFAILGIGKYIRTSVSIFMLAILIVYIFDSSARKESVKRYAARAAVALLVFMVLGFGLPKLVLRACYGSSDIRSYSGWNQIYIGLNESEFGFMDNDFSYDRSFDDVVNRIETYGPVKMAKIISKKTFWLWSQGTYQAERYAFGSDVTDYSEKFEYQTFLTGHLLNSGQPLRKLINAFMRAQYMILFLLMIISLWREDNADTYRLFYYIIIATFLIMLIYELKSRYILQLFPLMLIFAVRSIDEYDFLIKIHKINCQT